MPSITATDSSLTTAASATVEKVLIRSASFTKAQEIPSNSDFDSFAMTTATAPFSRSAKTDKIQQFYTENKTKIEKILTDILTEYNHKHHKQLKKLVQEDVFGKEKITLSKKECKVNNLPSDVVQFTTEFKRLIKGHAHKGTMGRIINDVFNKNTAISQLLDLKKGNSSKTNILEVTLKSQPVAFAQKQSLTINSISVDKNTPTWAQTDFDKNRNAMATALSGILNEYKDKNKEKLGTILNNMFKDPNLQIGLDQDNKLQVTILSITVEDFTAGINKLIDDHGHNGSFGKIIKSAFNKQHSLGQLFDIKSNRLNNNTLKVTLVTKTQDPSLTGSKIEVESHKQTATATTQNVQTAKTQDPSLIQSKSDNQTTTPLTRLTRGLSLKPLKHKAEDPSLTGSKIEVESHNQTATATTQNVQTAKAQDPSLIESKSNNQTATLTQLGRRLSFERLKHKAEDPSLIESKMEVESHNQTATPPIQLRRSLSFRRPKQVAADPLQKTSSLRLPRNESQLKVKEIALSLQNIAAKENAKLVQEYFDLHRADINKECSDILTRYAQKGDKYAQGVKKLTDNMSEGMSVSCKDNTYTITISLEEIGGVTNALNKLTKVPDSHKIIQELLNKKTHLGQLLRTPHSIQQNMNSSPLNVTTKHALSPEATTNLKIARENKQASDYQKKLHLPELLKRFKAESAVYKSNLDLLATQYNNFTLAGDSLNRLSGNVNFYNLDQALALNHQMTIDGKKEIDNMPKPNMATKPHLLFDSDKTYTVDDYDVMSHNIEDMKAQVSTVQDDLSTRNAILSSMTDGLPREKDLTPILGIDPADIDVDNAMAGVTKLRNMITIENTKFNWRSFIINLFHPSGFENEKNTLTLDDKRFSSVKRSQEDLSILSDITENNFSTASTNFILAKNVEALEKNCRSYKIGPFSLASPYKKELNAFLASENWPK